ncbi:MAG TPA: 2-amino-4-hydroxy-6-hydroxymethyldihydropteridine diphosphokinase [Thermoleophilaceae bacterium]|nr:2-amino-4-hydroxy-6-hydroxymethyldihydropteridine diphosphokinase [Thermoleophilaceae bacterium]
MSARGRVRPPAAVNARGQQPERARTGYLGLGSNMGDRLAHLRRARAGLASRGVTVTASSSVYETEPVGAAVGQADFLNACVRVRTGLGPEPLLDACKGLERALGREPDARHGPRPIDLDVLLLGDLRYEGDRITLPHRDLGRRRFVLVPLLELDPSLTLPGGPAAKDLLAALAEERVERIGPL